MSTLTTIAPGKINWTLEVLGKREDGYHEIRSVMQTIELHDELRKGDGGGELESVRAAIEALGNAGYETRTNVYVTKRVPVAAGLGGGSSDAAATLRLLDSALGLNLGFETLADIGAGVGSDVPFFVHGGTALVEGRGERITRLPDARTTWMVLVAPPISIAEKTRTMYAALRESDFSDGMRTAGLVEHFAGGGAIQDSLICNAFERAAYEVFAGLGKYREWLLEAGAGAVHLCGAGPALFALASGEAEARAIRGRLTRPKMGERTWVVRTIGRAEATAVWEE
jgi:4-diphosphocytidyl-2-C-methyl-D-erythritol kinase